MDRIVPTPKKKKKRLALKDGMLKYILNNMKMFPSDVVTKHKITAKMSVILLLSLIFYSYYCNCLLATTFLLMLADKSFLMVCL